MMEGVEERDLGMEVAFASGRPIEVGFSLISFFFSHLRLSSKIFINWKLEKLDLGYGCFCWKTILTEIKLGSWLYEKNDNWSRPEDLKMWREMKLDLGQLAQGNGF